MRHRLIVSGLDDMSECFESVKKLVAAGDVRISEHGYDELAEDRIPVRAILNGVDEAIVVEDYPDFSKGPAVLVLQFDELRRPNPCRMGNTEGALKPSRCSNCIST